MQERYQVVFDGGRQSRYFRTRREMLRYVLSVALRAEDPRFAVWEDAGPVVLADGRAMGRRFRPVATWDLRDGDLYDALLAELATLEAQGGDGT